MVGPDYDAERGKASERHGLPLEFLSSEGSLLGCGVLAYWTLDCWFGSDLWYSVERTARFSSPSLALILITQLQIILIPIIGLRQSGISRGPRDLPEVKVSPPWGNMSLEPSNYFYNFSWND